MKDKFAKHGPDPSKHWSKRLLNLFGTGTCDCEGSCSNEGCFRTCGMGTGLERTENYFDIDNIEKTHQPTLSTVQVGETASVEQIYLPLAQKKRLLSLGLTCGTEIGVISNENGRMIVSVRDSRLGLSPEVASRITYGQLKGD